MHGRVKVRTSEEERARKEKERQEKLKEFKHVMQKISTKRKNNQLDKELLDFTGQLLLANPDIYTLWNIRRDVLKLMRDTESDDECIIKLYDAELYLTEHCLKINPKSYCAWHQREWVLTTRADPDWKKELSLCEKYLKLDERNFHTWDYRRFIVSHCKPSLKDEFDFTTEKLLDNFSNYSAWHYRSKMLVELYPDLEGGRPIEDSHHKHELELVQSAAFTDPDDTSAWFYQRWLLSAVKDTTDIVVCMVTPNKTTVAFNKCVSHSIVNSRTKLFFNDVMLDCKWESCTGIDYDCLWICNHHENVTEGLNIKVEFDFSDNSKQVISCVKLDSLTYLGKVKIDFKKQYSQPVIAELNKQLESCRQLLNLEPDNKWTLLATTIFLHCIDPTQYYKESMENLLILKTIDKMRQAYYDDIISKWCIEHMLTANYESDKSILKFTWSHKITCLPHLQYFSYCRDVDLSNHNLTSQVLPSLIMLQHCKVLNLDNNKITSLKLFPKLQLERIILTGNDINQEEIATFKNIHNNCDIVF